MRVRCLLFFVFFAGTFFAQENSLLWRITGKNLAKPSYLYGTMHVKDKRVFYTNDSLQQFISSCDLFALELHPDSLNALIFNISEKDSTRDYHKYFNEEEYNQVDEKVQKDLGISLKELKTKNMRHLKMLLSPTKKRNDDYPTFLDGYLLNVARRYNKSILGLESNKSHEMAINVFGSERDLKDQIVELTKEKKSEDTYSKLIKSYTTENIKEIHDRVAEYSVDMSEIVINLRNVAMAKTIDSVVKQNTIFAACGSAHLGGEAGIIKLLQKMGYTVTPVVSKKKSYLNAEKLPFHFESYWQKVSMPSFGVNYVLPGAPIAYKKEIFLSETKMYMDVSNGSVYMILPVSITTDMNLDKHGMFEKVAEAMVKKAVDKKGFEKKFGTIGNAEYMDISFEFKMGFNIAARLFIENNILYDFLIVSPLNYNIEKEKEYFFSGISLYKPIEQKTYLYQNALWSFQLNLPDKPVEVKSKQKAGGTTLEILSLKTSDNIAGVHYLFECVEAGEGRYYTNDTAVLNEVYDKFKEQKRLISIKDTMVNLQGSIGKQFVAIFDDNSTCISWTIMRGFKFYSLMAITTKKNYESGVHKAIFESFSFTNPKLTDFKWTKAPFDSLFSIKLPGTLKLKSYEDETYGEKQEKDLRLHTSFETGYGITYYLQKFKESNYYYTLSDSAYWKETEKSLVNYNDSLIESSKLSFKNLNARRYIIKEKNSTCSKYYSIFNFGNYYYSLFANIPDKVTSEYLLSPLNNIVYTGQPNTQIINDTVAFNNLISDYYSSDTVKNDLAHRSIYGFKVTDDMYPQFIKAYENAGKDTTGNLKQSLVNKFKDFNKTKTLFYVKNKLFTTRNDTLYDEDYLRILAQFKTAGTNEWIKNFFGQRLYKLSEYSNIFYTLQDSIQLAKIFYPDILATLAKDTAENTGLMNLTSSLLDSSYITYSSIRQYENDLVNYSSRYINAKVKDKDFLDFYFPRDVLDILFVSDNKEMQSKLLLKLQQSNNIWGKYYSVIYALKSKNNPDPKVINDVVKLPYFRNLIYTELEKNKRLDLFPTPFKNQRSLAEADLISTSIDYDEYTPEEVKFVKEIKTTYEKKEVIFYIFKVSFKDDTEQYIAYTGPYEPNGELINNAELTGLGDKYVKGIEEFMLYEYLNKSK